MKNRKKDILSVSRKLFNESGYSQVTIRMIAMALNISSGNLNYHFKKREDILEALYFEMVTEFDARIENLEDSQWTFETILEDMQSSMERMVAYRFFWTDLYNLLQSNEKIRQHFEKVYKGRYMGYQKLFDVLKKQGYLKNFESKEERAFLAERMIGFSNTWIYSSNVYQKELNHETIRREANKLLFMLYPYLTNHGKEAYKSAASDFFVE